ncbi:PREDICTED: ankyrin repeat and SOCS box protein 8 [Apaloderma vittatum]|uniref:ankyrin repeat and SOCS box protein 8 n=1 Tax=Apaloderma vittatum TaxID=57397 RepID=UPI00052196FC|nr:PREDICTED: ankyrin repeat and SOCS box protein 8 [Apaloderma vittatum]
MHGTLKPLHCACMVADADCVELLLQKGAEKEDLKLIYYLIFGHEVTPLSSGIVFTPRIPTSHPLNSGCGLRCAPAAAGIPSVTPKSFLLLQGNLESVSVLLDFGAEARAVNLKGQTPVSRLVTLLVRGLGTEREYSCFDLLHRAVGHLELRKNGSMPWEVTRDQQLCQKLTLLCSAPGTLQTLARYAVRRSLGVRFLPEAVKQLPLPPSLKEYVLLLR